MCVLFGQQNVTRVTAGGARVECGATCHFFRLGGPLLSTTRTLAGRVDGSDPPKVACVPLFGPKPTFAGAWPRGFKPAVAREATEAAAEACGPARWWKGV